MRDIEQQILEIKSTLWVLTLAVGVLGLLQIFGG